MKKYKILTLIGLLLILLMGFSVETGVSIFAESNLNETFTAVKTLTYTEMGTSETSTLSPTIEPTVILTPLDIGNPVPEWPDDGNMYNGYWWGDEGWVAGLITFESQFMRMPPLVIGSAVYYAPQVMEANIEYRGLPYDKNYYVGAVAVTFCSEIGHEVWLKRPNFDWEGPFLVVDCSRRNDLYGHIMFRDQVVEVDFETAVRWGMAQYGGTQNEGRWSALTPRLDGVILSMSSPFDTVLGSPVDLSEWFPYYVTYAEQSENRRQVQNYVPPGYDGTTWGGLGFKNPSAVLPLWLINGEWVMFP